MYESTKQKTAALKNLPEIDSLFAKIIIPGALFLAPPGLKALSSITTGSDFDVSDVYSTVFGIAFVGGSAAESLYASIKNEEPDDSKAAFQDMSA